jgi:gamma-glutamylcyclotransferase (GGCT)/AIG2-like uncharacterized protein YtfP
MSLVFAYGSNLSSAQMRDRCPSARVVVTATLPGAELAFAGYSSRWGGAVATFLPGRVAGVRGVVYRVIESDLLALDRFEGVPFVYDRVSVDVLSDSTKRRAHVDTYKLPDDAARGTPSLAYLARIARAYRELGFDRRALSCAASLDGGLTV